MRTSGCWSSPCCLCSVLYPLVLWGIGQTVFHDKAQGSLVTDAKGKPIGSRLIAQPFTRRRILPAAALGGRRYNAAASGASNWAASNYLLRDRVARQLGPIVKYRSGPKKGQLVGPGHRKLVPEGPVRRQAGDRGPMGQRCTPRVAQNWVKADKLNAAYVADWQKTHPAEVDQWIKDNPDTPRAEARGPGRAVLHQLLEGPSGHVPQRRRAQDGRREDGEEDRAGQGRDATSSPASSTCGWQEHPDADLERCRPTW